MEGSSSSSSFPASYVTLKDLQERWLKRKEEEEEKEKLRKIQEEEEIKLRKQKEEREKLRKLRRDEEIELRKKKEEREKLRKLRRDEEIKIRSLKKKRDEIRNLREEEARDLRMRSEEEKNLLKLRREEGIGRKQKEEEKSLPSIDDRRRPFARSHGALASRDRREEHRAESINENPAAKSDRSPAIRGRRKGRMRGSSRFGDQTTESQSAVNVLDNKAEKTEKGLKSSEMESTAEIIDRVENIAVAGDDVVQRRLRRTISRSGRGYGGFEKRIPICATKGMVWVRKTEDA